MLTSAAFSEGLRLARFLLGNLGYPLRVLHTAYFAFSSAFWERPRGRQMVRRVMLQQVYFTAVQALPLTLFAGVVIGAFVMIQAGSQLASLGIWEVEAIVGWALFQEISSPLVAFVVIVRSATAIVVEIGNMRVNGETQALETLGINLDRFLVLPRLLAMLLSVPLLAIAFSTAALWGGFWLADLSGLMEKGSLVFARLSLSLDLAIVQSILVRAIVFGFFIGSVACYHGFQVKVSPTEVPQQATQAAVNALILCLFFNVALSIIGL